MREFSGGMKVPSREWTCRGYSGRIHKVYDRSAFKKAVCPPRDLWNSSLMRILLDSRNRIGVVPLPAQTGSRDIAVKEFRVRGIDRIKSRFLASKARKAWKGGCLLQDKNIPTPFPVAYLEPKEKASGKYGYYLCEWISGAVEIRNLFTSLPGEEMQTLLEKLAEFLRYCHDKGVWHRDLSDGNVLVSKENNAEYRFFLLDTNRVRFRNHIGLFKRAKNLVRLGVPSAHQRFFIRCYPGISSGWFWLGYRFNKAFFSGHIKIKKKLKLKKIARALHIQ